MTATSTRVPAVPSHIPARGAGFLVGPRVFTVRSLKHSFRDGESLLMAVLLPLMLMLIFTYVLGGAMNVGPDGDAAEAREAYLAFVLPATAVVLLAGFAVGFRTDANVLEFLGAVGIIALWILVITCVFAMLGMVAGSAEAANGYGFVLLFLPYISSGFAQVETMPAWLRPIAEHQPMTPIIDASRALLNGQRPGSELWVGLLWCAGLLTLAVWLIAVIFPRKVARV